MKHLVEGGKLTNNHEKSPGRGRDLVKYYVYFSPRFSKKAKILRFFRKLEKTLGKFYVTKIHNHTKEYKNSISPSIAEGR